MLTPSKKGFYKYGKHLSSICSVLFFIQQPGFPGRCHHKMKNEYVPASGKTEWSVSRLLTAYTLHHWQDELQVNF